MGIFDKILGKVKEVDDDKVDRSYRPDFKAMNDLGEIPVLMEWSLNSDVEVAEEAASAIQRILNSRSSFDNKVLYFSFRYIRLRKADLKRLERFSVELNSSLLCIASMNSSGYVREEALKRLAKNLTDIVFPFVLFRLSDWVGPVRKLADELIRKVIDDLDPTLLVKYHDIYDWLLKIQRKDLLDIHTEITEVLFSKANVQRIIDSVDSYDEKDRFYVFKNLTKRELLTDEILRLIVHDKSPIIRLLSVRNYSDTLSQEMLELLLRDKSQKVRLYSIQKIESDEVPIYLESLESMLFDNSAAIRSLARDLISSHKEVDFYKTYREELLASQSVGSILGLSEMGSAKDIDKLEDILKSNLAKKRAATLIAISNLDIDRGRELAFQMLTDDSNTVKKSCLVIILKERSSGDIEILRSLFDKTGTETKRFCLKAISKYGGWSIVGDYLKAVSENNSDLNSTAYMLLSSWYSYSIGLATPQTEADREYVIKAYEGIDMENLEIPFQTKKIISRIPFIFKG